MRPNGAQCKESSQTTSQWQYRISGNTDYRQLRQRLLEAPCFINVSLWCVFSLFYLLFAWAFLPTKMVPFSGCILQYYDAVVQETSLALLGGRLFTFLLSLGLIYSMLLLLVLIFTVIACLCRLDCIDIICLAHIVLSGKKNNYNNHKRMYQTMYLWASDISTGCFIPFDFTSLLSVS